MKPPDSPLARHANVGFDAITQYLADTGATITPEVRFKLAARRILEQNYMEHREEPLFRATVAAVLMTLPPEHEEHRGFLQSLEATKITSAYLACRLAGVPVDMPDESKTKPAYTLYEWWCAVRLDPDLKLKVKLEEPKP